MNILTIDLEDWFHLLYRSTNISMDQWEQQISILEENTDIILNLLQQYNTHATFFVLGWVAEKYPSLVSKIAEHGHEIANHGYSHQEIDRLTYKTFYNDLIKAHKAIYKASGSNPIGYRAPGCSIMQKNIWALDIIQKEGYIYDSSIFRSRLKTIHISGKTLPQLDNGLFELPINNNNLFSIHTLGGLSLRVIPQKILLNIISGNIQNSIPSIVVIHPRELNDRLPKLNLGFINYIKTYYKLNNCIYNIKFLLEHFSWLTAETFVKAYQE